LTLSGRPYVERQHFLDIASPSFSLARFAQPSRKALARAADQQRRWRRGERVLVEEYLARWPTLAEDAESLLDLVYGEVLLREESGETVALEEYLRRFPAHELSLERQFELHRALATGALPVSEAVGTEVSSPPSQEQPETLTVPPTLASEAMLPDGVSPPTQVGISRREQPSPATVPGYEILGTLGKGGMGVVYQARHLALNRVVALKMILSGAHAATAERQRFRTEAEAVARLQHPGIVQIYEVGDHNGLPYLSLEYCPGGSLEKRLAGTPLPPREAGQLVEHLARAVQAAHDKHVVHRDLKPANVLLAEDGTPKVTDFGLVKRLDEAGRTQTGAIMGTPSYMAPEQAGGKTKAVGPVTDVYALGAILYECLTGRPPFRGRRALDTLEQVRYFEPTPPRQLRLSIPRDLETICLKSSDKTSGTGIEPLTGSLSYEGVPCHGSCSLRREPTPVTTPRSSRSCWTSLRLWAGRAGRRHGPMNCMRIGVTTATLRVGF
jgi:serine/threonine-protein kinase